MKTKKKVFCLLVVLGISVCGFAQSISLPSSSYYADLLQANGCGSAGGMQFPSFVFEQACNQHDIDYGTIGIQKSVADRNFFKNMANACADTFGYNAAALTGCVEIASIYFLAVKVFGGNAYQNAQSLARKLQEAKERERGICYPADIFVQKNGDTYYVAINW